MRNLFALLVLAGLSCPLAGAPVPDWARPGGAVLLQDADDDEDDGLSEEGYEADAELALDNGRYKSAKLYFRRALKEDDQNQQAVRGLAQAYDQTGDYRFAIRYLEKVTDPEDETLVWLGRMYLKTGQYDLLFVLADKLLASESVVAGLDGYLFKGHLLRLKGQYEEATAQYLKVRDIVVAQRADALRIDRDKGRQPALADLWCTAGEAYYWMNRLHEANDCWANALIADEYHHRTNSWMASLYLQQNHDSSSRVNYSEFYLRHNENAAEMKLRLAQAHFFKWRGQDGLRELNGALEINPNHPEALAVRALRYLYTDQYDLAKKDYERALKTNPHYAEALGAKALHGKMLALEETYKAAEEAMLAINPKPARFFEIIADGLSDRFRYREALPLYEKALEYNPKHWTAYKGRGFAALNFGDDKLGKESLEVALDKDPLRNNLRTVNMLTLLDSYKHFERYESEDGRWRLLVHKSESAVMMPLYIEHLEDAYESQSKKYDYEIDGPLTVEAFHRHEDFEVRTVGITGLPALGACFGNLITLDSPSARPPGSYNWASTLRHEMDHAFQLNISNGQIPRWMAEGLSVYEEKSTRPEWERHMEDQLFMRYHMDDIPPITKFNEWFRDGSRVLFAYYLGNVMLEFIDKELGGMGTVRKMLEMFGQKETPGVVFETCLGISPEEYDKQFRAYVRDKRIAHLKMVPQISPDRIDELYFKYEDGVADVHDLVELALGYMQQGSRFDADTFLGLAKKQGADEMHGEVGAWYWYTRAGLYRADSDLARAERAAASRRAIETALALGLEDFQTFMMLAQFAQQDQDAEMVLHWLQEANRAFPESPQPYAYMYQMYQQQRKRDLAIEMAEKWMMVDENNLQIRMWLITEVYDPGHNWSKMAEMAEQAMNIAPLDRRTHQAYGFALRKLERWQDSVDAFEYVRRLAVGTPEEARAIEAGAVIDQAVTWLHAEDIEKCREKLAEAREIDPDNERIKTIEEELDLIDKEEEEGS